MCQILFKAVTHSFLTKCSAFYLKIYTQIIVEENVCVKLIGQCTLTFHFICNSKVHLIKSLEKQMKCNCIGELLNMFSDYISQQKLSPAFKTLGTCKIHLLLYKKEENSVATTSQVSSQTLYSLILDMWEIHTYQSALEKQPNVSC